MNDKWNINYSQINGKVESDENMVSFLFNFSYRDTMDVFMKTEKRPDDDMLYYI